MDTVSLVQMIGVMLGMAMIWQIGRALEVMSVGVAGCAKIANDALAILLEERTYEIVNEITEVADYRVWAALSVDRLQLPLGYQDELEHAANYCWESSMRDGEVDAGAAFARAVVLIVREYANNKVTEKR